jgi:hypothetical protein
MPASLVNKKWLNSNLTCGTRHMLQGKELQKIEKIFLTKDS